MPKGRGMVRQIAQEQQPMRAAEHHKCAQEAGSAGKLSLLILVAGLDLP